MRLCWYRLFATSSRALAWQPTPLTWAIMEAFYLQSGLDLAQLADPVRRAPHEEPERACTVGAPRVRVRRSGDGERLSFPLLEPFPFQLGHFLDQILHPAIVVDGLTNALLPSLGNADLARFPVMALDQIQRRMQFACNAMTAGLPHLAARSTACRAGTTW